MHRDLIYQGEWRLALKAASGPVELRYVLGHMLDAHIVNPTGPIEGTEMAVTTTGRYVPRLTGNARGYADGDCWGHGGSGGPGGYGDAQGNGDGYGDGCGSGNGEGFPDGDNW